MNTVQHFPKNLVLKGLVLNGLMNQTFLSYVLKLNFIEI